MPQHLVLHEVVLDEAVEEGDLEVDEALVRGEGHRSHGGAHVRLSGLLELLAHVDAPGPERAGVDDLEPAVALGVVERRVVGGVKTEPMLAWKIRLPSAEKLFSCGWSPDSKLPTIRPVAGSITWTLRGRGRHEQPVPSGEIAMWSAR